MPSRPTAYHPVGFSIHIPHLLSILLRKPPRLRRHSHCYLLQLQFIQFFHLHLQTRNRNLNPKKPFRSHSPHKSSSSLAITVVFADVHGHTRTTKNTL